MIINDREYKTGKETIVGICMDGTSYPYYEMAKDVMPNLQRFIREGSVGMVKSVIPSFTNPNNMAITTGVPPSINGICGNFYWDTDLQEEVMMNDPKYLKVPTILSEFSKNGRKVAVVTAKEKLRRMLAHNLDGICFSAEFASTAYRLNPCPKSVYANIPIAPKTARVTMTSINVNPLLLLFIALLPILKRQIAFETRYGFARKCIVVHIGCYMNQ